MKRLLIFVAAPVLLLIATGAEGPQDRVARLKSVDTSMCAEEASGILIQLNTEAYDTLTEKGDWPPEPWTVVATGVNKDIGEISCQASFPEAEAKIDFTVRPSLTRAGWQVVEVADTPGSERMARWMEERASRKAKKDPASRR